MSASLSLLLCGLLSLRHGIHAQTLDKTVCNTTNCGNLAPSNLLVQCTSTQCELECATSNACNALLYSCNNDDGNTTDTTSCTINCQDTNSCSGLTVISNSAILDVNCNTANSCLDSSFVCNPSTLNGAAQCTLSCDANSCQTINYLCTGYTTECHTQCSGENSCTALDMVCDQHLSDPASIADAMTCDVACDDSNTCDSSSSFACTESSNAQCSCSGSCSNLQTYAVNTQQPTLSPTIEPTTSPTASSTDTAAVETSRSHTFDVVDIEVYATFTILWLLLFLVAVGACWRLHVTLDFFRNVRTVVLLVVLLVFEVFYYFIFCTILWGNSIAYSQESSIHFYVWTSYLPVMLHISLLFSLCAYYNKHFHRDSFLALFCCYAGTTKRKIPKILKHFNLCLCTFFMIPMIATIAANTDAALIAVVSFIGIFGLLGTIMSCCQCVVAVFDAQYMDTYEEAVEKLLVVFILITSVIFVIIFSINLTIAFEWDAQKTAQNIASIRVTQLSLELIVLIAVTALIFYIYYEFIFGLYEDEDEEEQEEGADEYEVPPANLDLDTAGQPPSRPPTYEHAPQDSIDVIRKKTNPFSTPSVGPQTPDIPRRSTRKGSSNVAGQRKRTASRAVFNDPEDEEMDGSPSPGIGRNRGSIFRKSTAEKQMKLSIASTSQQPTQISQQRIEEEDDDGYHTGDAVEIYYPDDWYSSMVVNTNGGSNNLLVRLLKGPNADTEFVLDYETQSDQIRLIIDAGNDEYKSNSMQSLVKDRYHNAPPPSIEAKLVRDSQMKKAKKRQLPDLPKFGAPLNKQKMVTVTDENGDGFEYYGEIPAILVLLKTYLFQFNAHKFVGIFANGSVENVESSPEFMEGVVSKVDCNGVKKLIESNQIEKHQFKDTGSGEEKHYAMVFAELIKMWLSALPEPLLQDMPSTFFGDITDIEFLEMEMDKIPEPNLSTLLYIWDICVLISIRADQNKMNKPRLAQVFAPYLFKDPNAERNQQIRPKLVNFFEIGINWRQQTSSHNAESSMRL